MSDIDYHERPEHWPEEFFVPAESFRGFHRFTWRNSEGDYRCMFCEQTHASPPDDPETSLSDVASAVPRVAIHSYKARRQDRPEWLEDWFSHCIRANRIDGFDVIDESANGLCLARNRPEPIDYCPPKRRSGTCFDNESEEMRSACVESIQAFLGADGVLHEVRHQRSGYHTDLAYLCGDDDAVASRQSVVGDPAPIHEPLQRFKVWWYCVERGPVHHGHAVGNGQYADPSTNKRHIKWLLENGYVAKTTTGHLVGVKPPAIGEIHAVELKLRDWKTALAQAARARRCDLPDGFPMERRQRYGYADYAWVALDAGAVPAALEHREAFRAEGVGLLSVCEGGTVHCHIEAEHRPRGVYTRDRAYIESEFWEALGLDESIAGQDATTAQDREGKQLRLVTVGGEGER